MIEQSSQRDPGALQLKYAQTRSGGAFPIGDRLVANVEHFFRGDIGEAQGFAEDPRVRFVGADFARDDDVPKKAREICLLYTSPSPRD